jgi:acyl-CoA thioesterase-1
MNRPWLTREWGGAPVWLVIAVILIAALTGAGAFSSSRQTVEPATADDDLYATLDTQPVVVALGDSYTAGAGASSRSNAWVSIVAGAEEWQLQNLARGGTGFTTAVTGDGAPLACGRADCPSFTDMAAEGASFLPDIVIVSGGRNNARLPLEQVSSDMRTFFDELTTAYPEAQIIVTNALWDDTEPPPSIAAMSDVLKEEAGRVGATFLNIGQPLQGSPEKVAQDGVHPSDAGHQAIADAVLAALGDVS